MKHDTSDKQIPIVDVAGALGGDAAAVADVGRQVRAACLEYGFFFMRGHGVAQEKIDAVYAASVRFFDQSAEVKAEVLVDRNFLGYTPLRSSQYKTETVGNDYTKPNEFEAFLIQRQRSPDDPEVMAGKLFRGLNQWPARLPGFRETLLDFMAEIGALGRKFLPVMCAAAGVPQGRFDAAFADPNLSLRLLHYPDQGIRDDRTFGIAPHTDFGFITLLAPTTVPGIEVRPRGMDWIVPPALPDCFLVNTGDLLQRWTNDLFLSTPHRVINTYGQDRYSVAFFYTPNSEYQVEPMPEFVSETQPGRYGPTSLNEHFGSAIRKNYAHLQDPPASTPTAPS